MEQLQFAGFGPCGCWIKHSPEGEHLILAAYSCPDCVGRALAYLEDMLYVDKVGSVSASEAEAVRAEEALGIKA